MRFLISMTVALMMLAPLTAEATAHRAHTVPTFLGGGNQDPFADGEHQATSADGRRVVFEDSGDFTGRNADGSNEIFLWDREIGYAQLTNNPAQSEGRVSALAIDRQGTTVVAASNMDPAASGATAPEIYRWTLSGGWERLTFTTGIFPLIHTPGLALSDDGRRVVFNSRADYTGENPDGEMRVFAWTEGAGFTQIIRPDECNPVGPSRVLDISGDGQRILLTSKCRYGEVNPNLERQLFLWDEATGLHPLTRREEGISATGSLNRDGTVAAVVGSNLTAARPEFDDRLYRWVEGHGFTKLNKHLTSSVRPSISDDGYRIAFVSSNSQGGSSNPDGNREVFLWHGGKRPRISQISDNPDSDSSFGSTRPSLSGDGTRLSLTARRAFGGDGDTRRGVYSVEIISAGPRGRNALIGGTFDDGLYAWNPQPGASHSADDGRESHSSGSARAERDVGEPATRVPQLSQCVAVQPDTEYALTALLRLFTSHALGAAQMKVSLHAGRACSDPGLPVTDPVSRPNNDGFWVGETLRFRTLDNTRTVRVVLDAHKPGGGSVEAGFDDVELRPVL